ncbi:4303_t:CDS:2, partial [Funneliformis mosseae]
KNTEFKAKYDKAKDEITKLRIKLRNRIEELEKARINTAVENTKYSRYSRKDFSSEKPADIPNFIVANEIVFANSKSSEKKVMNSFLNEVNKKIVSDKIRQKKLAKVETISSEKDKQISVDKRVLHDLIPSVSSQRESDSSANIIEMEMPIFSLLYKNFEALIQRRDKITSEKYVNLESNTVSRILNIEVKAQLPAVTFDALLWKRIEQAKKLYTLLI